MSLYLSRLVLDARSRQVAAELAHPYEMHRTLMRGFPSITAGLRAPREEFGVLFRPDLDERGNVVKVYVQSSVRPDWSFLRGIPRYLSSDWAGSACECRDIAPALQRIEADQILAFRLRANPTKRVGRRDDPMKGKRVELQSEEEHLAWLADKGRGGREGVPGGFVLLMKRVRNEEGGEICVPCVQVYREGKLTGFKSDSKGEHRTTHLAVVFDGLLRVTDAGAFVETVRAGVGSAKAYGFGLLSLAPSSTFSVGETP